MFSTIRTFFSYLREEQKWENIGESQKSLYMIEQNKRKCICIPLPASHISTKVVDASSKVGAIEYSLSKVES